MASSVIRTKKLSDAMNVGIFKQKYHVTVNTVNCTIESEIRLVNGPVTFCEAHSTDWWVAEHHCGDAGVVQLRVLLALEQSMCKLSACSNGNCTKVKNKKKQ